MFIVVDLASGTSRLEDPEDTRKFHVQLQGAGEQSAIEKALASFGRLEGEHAWIDPAAILRAAAGRTSPEWPEKFVGMVEYASSKGWVDEEGSIRAHIQRT